MLAKSKFPSTQPTPLRKPPPLDFAQLIAHRRACRVAQNTQMESNTNHFWNMKSSIELENAYQEKQRMESHLRLGNVPAHISHPIAAALVGRGNAMDVDEEEVPAGGKVAGRLELNHSPTQYPTGERAKDRERGIPNLEDYLPDELAIAHLHRTPKTPKMVVPEVLKRYNIKNRARNAQYTAKAARP